MGFLTLFPAILVVVQVGITSACLSYQFECTSGQCISEYERCDGVYDCYDGSDEYNCCTASANDKFRCSDGSCLYSYQKCNGVRECDDGSDEDYCCSSSQFTCQDDGSCLDIYHVCDGNPECDDGSDEDNCPSSHEYCYTFQCDSGQCLAAGDYECDGDNDCSDGSDEDNCGSSIGLIIGLTTPFAGVGLIAIISVTAACYYRRRQQRIRVPVVRHVARPRNHEVIMVTCNNFQSASSPGATTNRFVDGASVGGHSGLCEAPPTYSLTQDPSELASPPPQYSFEENPLATATPTLATPEHPDSLSPSPSSPPEDEEYPVISGEDRLPLLQQ